MEKICCSVIKEADVSEENREIVEYGIRQLPILILAIIGIGIIALVAKKPLECFIYCSLYYMLRIYAGGYHAYNRKRCFVVSMILVMIAMMFVEYCDVNIYILAAITLLGVYVIVLLAPVEALNKTLDEEEKIKYREILKKIIFLHMIILTIALILKIKAIINSIAISYLELCCMMIIGKCKLYIECKK